MQRERNEKMDGKKSRGSDSGVHLEGETPVQQGHIMLGPAEMH